MHLLAFRYFQEGPDAPLGYQCQVCYVEKASLNPLVHGVHRYKDVELFTGGGISSGVFTHLGLQILDPFIGIFSYTLPNLHHSNLVFRPELKIVLTLVLFHITLSSKPRR